ncbi:MAG: hypothetical protein IH614_03460 [Desulfuromonadales bacterium]|nr:hypothetical protein [Desulfuromonadales bacterium]
MTPLRLQRRLVCPWLCLFLLSLAVVGCAAREVPPPTPDAQVREETAEEKLGIEIVAIRLSAGGYLLDFRYRATDPERAIAFFDRQIKPYLLHEASGARFLVPAPAKVGPLRPTNNAPVAGKHYFIMFANPGQYIKAGDQVTVVFGDTRMEHLTVE